MCPSNSKLAKYPKLTQNQQDLKRMKIRWSQLSIEKAYLKYPQLPLQLEPKRMVPAKRSGKGKGHSATIWSSDPRAHHQYS